jgi:hypothetical protein
MTVGALATMAALRLGGTPTNTQRPVGSRGAMAALVEAPLGRVLLGIIAVGMFGYAAWRMIEAIEDPERHGHTLKGIALRVRSAVVVLIHVGLGYSAVKIAMGHVVAAQDGRNTQHWAARALATPGGTMVLTAVALGLVAYGLYQLYCAWRAKLGSELSLSALSDRARRFVIATSRFGIAARGVVFIATGGLVARGVRDRNPAEATGSARSLRELFELGTGPFVIVAIGLIAYGVYQLINAKYRRIVVA